MPDDSGKLKQGNFVQALESIRREAEGLKGRRDLPPDVKAGLDASLPSRVASSSSAATLNNRNRVGISAKAR